MVMLKAGDTVSCKIKAATIVSPYDSYEDIKSFVIVAVDECGYYLFVPHYIFLNNSMVAHQYRCRSLRIERKFLDEYIVYIQESMVLSVDKKRDGRNCSVCKEFYFYASDNQEDGSFICYSCRGNPYH